MLTSDSDDLTAVGYYSLLRYVPDPLRDEAVNVGLFLIDEAGTWARFDGEIPRGLIRNMRRSKEVPALERWIESTKNVYGAVGEPALIPGNAPIDRRMLERWSREFGAALRVTEPQTAVGSSFEELWRELFSRLVTRSETWSAVLPPTLERGFSPQATASGEREKLSRALVRTMQRWENFDRSRVHLQELFSGRKARHHVDVAVLNGSVTAVAKALPLVYGTEQDHITARALLVEAAFDLREEVVKLAIHDDPPSERIELLEESRSLLEDVPNTLLIARKEFPGLQDRFATRFFPEHDAADALSHQRDREPTWQWIHRPVDVDLIPQAPEGHQGTGKERMLLETTRKVPYTQRDAPGRIRESKNAGSSLSQKRGRSPKRDAKGTGNESKRG